MNLKSILLVFLGSGLGGSVRWCFGLIVGMPSSVAFPWATFIANVCACAISGFIGAWSATKLHSENIALFGLVGFCGGFSTMSAFSRESLQLIQGGSMVLIIYPLATFIACVGCTYLGVLCSNYFAG